MHTTLRVALPWSHTVRPLGTWHRRGAGGCEGRARRRSVVVRWCGGVVVRWCGGAVVRWCGGAVVRRARGRGAWGAHVEHAIDGEAQGD
eukprot:scaffold118724_cov63-Phaeocystis_antarctica.AAC.6